MSLWVKFMEVSGFHSPRDLSKRLSGIQHSPEPVLTSADGANYFLLKGLDGGSVTREALITQPRGAKSQCYW